MGFLKSLFKKKTVSDPPISIHQKELVQSSFAQVAPIADTAAEMFYAKLFELDPSLKPLFKNADMKQQGQKLMTMLAAAVKGLDDLDALVPIVQDLGRRHVGYGVKPEHYQTVGAALLDTLAKGLKDNWNDELKDAWTTAYTLLSTVMINASPYEQEAS